MKKPILHAALLFVFTLGLVSKATAQKIPDPSFETTSLQAPFVFGGDASAAAPPWSFGTQAGICQANVAYAANFEAAEGKQVAIIQGDPSLAAEEAQNVPGCIFGVDMTGLETGAEYELQWAQASRASDLEHGAISVVLTDPANPATNLALVQHLHVANKEKWEVEKHQFTATAVTMRLNILHFVPNLESGATGTESTLLDDFRIQKLK